MVSDIFVASSTQETNVYPNETRKSAATTHDERVTSSTDDDVMEPAMAWTLFTQWCHMNRLPRPSLAQLKAANLTEPTSVQSHASGHGLEGNHNWRPGNHSNQSPAPDAECRVPEWIIKPTASDTATHRDHTAPSNPVTSIHGNRDQVNTKICRPPLKSLLTNGTSATSGSCPSRQNLATSSSVRTAHPHRKHVCTVCKKTFVYQLSLDNHVANFHGDIQVPPSTPHTDKPKVVRARAAAKVSSIDVQAVWKTSFIASPFMCKPCAKAFPYKEDVEEHQLNCRHRRKLKVNTTDCRSDNTTDITTSSILNNVTGSTTDKAGVVWKSGDNKTSVKTADNSSRLLSYWSST